MRKDLILVILVYVVWIFVFVFLVMGKVLSLVFFVRLVMFFERLDLLSKVSICVRVWWFLVGVVILGVLWVLVLFIVRLWKNLLSGFFFVFVVNKVYFFGLSWIVMCLLGVFGMVGLWFLNKKNLLFVMRVGEIEFDCIVWLVWVVFGLFFVWRDFIYIEVR